jgi:dephospho-CoA kinase
MPNEHIFKFDTTAEVERYFDDSSLTNGAEPQIVVLAGGVASGKTTIRKERYSSGYVLVDAADIFLNLSRGEYFDFPGPFAQILDVVGPLIAKRAITERRRIVTEIIGSELVPLEALFESMRAVGYRVDFVFVECDPKQAWERNLSRGDDSISAHYAEHYQREWLCAAATELRPST